MIGAGVLVNAYLAIVGRQLSEAQYSHFGAFWSLSLVVAFGAFLPVEQELGRLLQTAADPRGALRAASRVSAGIAFVGLITVVVSLVPLSIALGRDAGLVVAIAALVVVSAVQFLVRGMLIGLNRIPVHAAVIFLDAALRVAGSFMVVNFIPSATAADFAWALVAAISLAHLPMLPLVMRESRRGNTSVTPVATAQLRKAVLPLLVGTLCAQVLLNGAPILVAAVASPGEQQAAGRFLAAFTLARIPLFIAVPLQSAILPSLTRQVESGHPAAIRSFLVRAAIILAVAGSIVVFISLIAGPSILRLVFGDRYEVPGRDFALMVAGSVTYLGLMLTTQALVASGLHGRVAQTWLTGTFAAVAIFASVPGLFLRAELAFLVGSAAAWVLGTVLLVQVRAAAIAPDVTASHGCRRRGRASL